MVCKDTTNHTSLISRHDKYSLKQLKKQNRFYRRIFAQANIESSYYNPKMKNLRNYRIPKLSNSSSEGTSSPPIEYSFRMSSLQRNRRYFTGRWPRGSSSSASSSRSGSIFTGHRPVNEDTLSSPIDEGIGSDTEYEPWWNRFGQAANSHNLFLQSIALVTQRQNSQSSDLTDGSPDASNSLSSLQSIAEDSLESPPQEGTNTIPGGKIGQPTRPDEADDSNDKEVLVIGLSEKEKREVKRWTKYLSRRKQ
ncbi:unnamed protein product [Orchesella dallaii]|uniref:Uncharacterized protein n=1 Tax=Orchesella dallaii TaxID=48710 RepID=A0ABP1PZZ0_9HEXA